MRVAVLVLGAGLAACLSKPDRPLAGSDANPTSQIVQVAHATGSADYFSNPDRVRVMPPDARQGDLVLLFLDRWYATTATTTGNGWVWLGAQNVDGDIQEVAYRVAGPTEASQGSAYEFSTIPDSRASGEYVVIVYRGANVASLVTSSTQQSAFEFDMPPGSTTSWFIDAACTDVSSECTGPTTVQSSYWKVAEQSGPMPTALTISCNGHSAATFAIRLDP